MGEVKTQSEMKKELLEKLAAAIKEVLPDYNEPVVLMHDQWTICWDGPFEWCMMIGGEISILGGEFADYSNPLETQIADVVKEIEAVGGYLEALDSSSQMQIHE